MLWGSVDWFKDKICSQGVDDPGAYFSHSRNGYQRYRHYKLLTALYASDLLEGRSDIRIGEVGCGTGELLALFCKEIRAGFAIGVDFVAEAITLASQSNPDIEFCTGHLPKIPESMRDMDLIIASEVLYYLSDEDRKIAIERLYNALNPGGVLLFSSVLGRQYFDTESANNLLGRCFNTSVVSYQYNRLYHALVRPVTLINSAKFRLYAGTHGVSEKQNEFIKKYQWLVMNPFVKFGVYAVSKVFSPLLTWYWLPHACGSISQSIGGTRFRSNVVIIVQRTE